MRARVLVGAGVALALAAGLALSALTAPGPGPGWGPGSTPGPVPAPASGITPAGGVIGNSPYCSRDYERLDGDDYIAYNDDSGDYTCLRTTNQQTATGFTVTAFQQDIPGGVGAYPNVFAGFEWGRHPKNSFLPAEESKDGDPETAVSVTSVPGGYYNAAYDIWFNQTDPDDPWTLGRDNGTEVMIWLVTHEASQGSGHYKIDGRTWRMMKWVAGNHQTGATWNYIAFIAPNDVTTANLALNPFFKEAIALDWLSPSWYLTTVGFGFEMFSGNLAGLAVKSFNLTGVQSGAIPPAPTPKKKPNFQPRAKKPPTLPPQEGRRPAV
jgi:Glycosyl hydrolase family 12